MMSWKTYLWVNGILTGLMLCSAGLTAWLYLSGYMPDFGWIALAQFVPAVGNAALFALTYRGTRRRIEQARADARTPAWQPPSAKLDW